MIEHTVSGIGGTLLICLFVVATFTNLGSLSEPDLTVMAIAMTMSFFVGLGFICFALSNEGEQQ